MLKSFHFQINIVQALRVVLLSVSGKVPRGFTRYYVLYLLSEDSLTGKEIIDLALERSEGVWSPSPGLIYPLLGRLVRDGLIKEVDEGGYAVTEEGEKSLHQYSELQAQIDRQSRLVNKLGISIYAAGKFLADEAVGRISSVSSTVWDHMTMRSDEAQRRFEERYEDFLLKELERIKQKKIENSCENIEDIAESVEEEN